MSEQEKKYSILYPKREVDNDYFIDNDFYREVILHCVKNRMKILEPPLILCVQGKAGEGKTTHIIKICNKLQITLFVVHGSSLCGDKEGAPLEVVKNTYLDASKYKKTYNCKTIILIDDIDTSVASTSDDRKYTANSQLVNGVLMNIANNPCKIEGKDTERIPIIFTGNNLMNLYAPLKRTGRIRIFSWTPKKEQKIEIIKHIYREIISDKESKDFLKIITPHLEQPISFFVDLKNNLFDSFIINEINKHNNIDDIDEIEQSVCSALNQYSYLSIIERDINSLANNKLQNFSK